MSYKDRSLLTDAEGFIIPQYYDPKEDIFKPLTDGLKVIGNKVEEQLTEEDISDGTLTFSENIEFVGIYNTDETNKGVFNVNGIDIHVPPGEYVEFNVGGTPRNTITITGATTFIVTRFV